MKDHSFPYHKPVLLEEAVAALQIASSGRYVDATFGGGGHSRAILQAMGPDGKLIAFDQDAEAEQNLPQDDRVIWIPENFRYLKRFLRLKNQLPVNGVLADLGVSSYQFDTAERGFSIRMGGPLDMRMDHRQKKTAAEILRNYDLQSLWDIFEKYGEVRNAKSLATHLIRERKRFPIKTVQELKALIKPLVIGNERRYFAQVFQAIRIEVNDEINALKEFLKQSQEVLMPGGRLVVITFHSIEDRIVKQFLNGEDFDNNEILAKEKIKRWKLINKKPMVSSREELKRNSRAGSAKMRIGEKMKN